MVTNQQSTGSFGAPGGSQFVAHCAKTGLPVLARGASPLAQHAEVVLIGPRGVLRRGPFESDARVLGLPVPGLLTRGEARLVLAHFYEGEAFDELPANRTATVPRSWCGHPYPSPIMVAAAHVVLGARLALSRREDALAASDLRPGACPPVRLYDRAGECELPVLDACEFERLTKRFKTFYALYERCLESVVRSASRLFGVPLHALVDHWQAAAGLDAWRRPGAELPFEGASLALTGVRPPSVSPVVLEALADHLTARSGDTPRRAQGRTAVAAQTLRRLTAATNAIVPFAPHLAEFIAVAWVRGEGITNSEISVDGARRALMQQLRDGAESVLSARAVPCDASAHQHDLGLHEQAVEVDLQAEDGNRNSRESVR